MRVLIDMDEITVDLINEWLRAYNQEWSDNVKRADITDWDFHKFVKPACGKKVYDILKRPGFFDYLPPHAGAVDAITELVEHGHDVRFATAPPSSDAARGKIEWVMREFKHLDFGISHVLQLHDKSWLNADVLIDDKPQTIKEWANKPGCTIMTIAHPHNKDCKDIADVYAQSYKDTKKAWKTIVNAINNLEEK